MKNYISILLLALVALTGCQGESQDSTETTEEVSKDLSAVKVGALKVEPLINSIRSTGTIDVPPMERKVFHSFIGANITKLNIIQGEKVAKGQVLAELSHPNLILLQQELLQEQVEMDYLEKELLRKQRLSQANASSAKEINALQKAFDQSKIKFQTVKSQIELLGLNPSTIIENGIESTILIKAPFDAQVSKVLVSNGQYVDTNDPILELLQTDHKHLELDVFAMDADKIKIGQRIEFQLPGSDQKYGGEVFLINPDVNDNKLRVHGHLDNESLGLKIGTFIEAKIILSSNEVTLIENDELIRDGDDFYLFQKSGNAFEIVQVNIGLSNDQFTEVITTSNASNWVIKGNYYLQEF